MKRFQFLAGVALAATMTQTAKADSHEYIDSHYRGLRNVYVVQGLEGQWGGYTSTMRSNAALGAVDTGNEDTKSRDGWTGFGLKNEVGVEAFRFIRVGVGHTFVNMRNTKDSLQKLTGSRLSLEGKLVFDAPICNLELGLGAIGSKLDYQNKLETGEFLSTGVYTLYGINYFMTPSVSVYLNYKSLNETLRPQKGIETVERIEAETQIAAFGFSLWI